MQRVIQAVQQLLKVSAQDSQSPLFGVKKVFFGDPIAIPESDLPSIAIQPVWTGYSMRWSRVDQKVHEIEIRLIYNAKDYFNKNLWPEVTITAASWNSWIITFTAQDHGLSVWHTVQVDGVKPDWFNGAFYVASTPSANTFTVSSITDPWTYSTGWKFMKSQDDMVFAVEDAIVKVEKNDLFHWTAALTVCGTIQKNTGLPFTDASGTSNTCELSQVTAVRYTRNDERWFPSWETITTIQVVCIGDR